ncbi:MAG: MarR family transcriptional regulator [Candidatus Obscuribacterales bacterium]|nr:MarR family transcriptional regulator [Candidatus Obscuribacterales bacterium]
MDFLIAKKHFFRHVATSKLTGEQLRVLMCLLSREADGVIGMWQKEIAEMLGIAEPNVSRSIKALMKAGVLMEKLTTGHKDIPIFKLNLAFGKQAQLEVDYQYEKKHGKPFKPTW